MISINFDQLFNTPISKELINYMQSPVSFRS
jgi:hypothetical protein